MASNISLSRAGKGRRVLGSDHSLIKLHDTQLEYVEKSMKGASKSVINKHEDYKHPRSRSRSKEQPPRVQKHSSAHTKVTKKEETPSKASLNSLKKKPSIERQSEHKLKEAAAQMNTTFLNELDLYMKQAQYSADDSETDSAGSKQNSDFEANISALELETKQSKAYERNVSSKQRVASPPLSDASDEDLSAKADSATTSDTRTDSNDDLEHEKNEKTKSNLKSEFLSDSTVHPKIESQIMKEISASNVHSHLVKQYLSECEGSLSSLHSRSSTSSNSQKKGGSYRRNVVNVPELTVMVQQIPKISTFEKNILALKNSASSCQSDNKEGHSFRHELINGSMSVKSEATANNVTNEHEHAKRPWSNGTNASGKSNVDRTTIKITHLSPDEMPSAMLKSMVHGVVAVTEPEFELHSTLRFPTKSLYVLFKSEETASKAMEFLQNSNIHCDYREIE